MKMVSATITILLLLVASSEAFTSSLPRRSTAVAPQSSVLVWSTTEEAAPTTADAPSDLADVEIPTSLPSDCGKDYIPLATMLATGQFQEADQVRQSELCVFVMCEYFCRRSRPTAFLSFANSSLVTL